jgi:hypothetical protein
VVGLVHMPPLYGAKVESAFGLWQELGDHVVDRDNSSGALRSRETVRKIKGVVHDLSPAGISGASDAIEMCGTGGVGA